MEAYDASRVAAAVPANGMPNPVIRLRFRRWPRCPQSPVYTEVMRVHVKKDENKQKTLKAGLVSQESVQALLAAMK